MPVSMNISRTAVVAAALLFSFSGASVSADMSQGGREGPVVFNDQILNASMEALNHFVQARYAHDDMMASLHAPAPQKDFVVVAKAVSAAPAMAPSSVRYGFGPAINGGASLDVHLAAFHDELAQPDPLFVRIAVAAGGIGLDFAEAGAVPAAPGDLAAFGPEIWDDETMNEHMFSLADHMLEHAERNATLFPDNPAITGTSFDLYGKSLTLY